MAHVRDRFARVGDLRVHFRDWAGPADDAPLLALLHGASSDAQMWDRFCSVLAASYHVIAPDARGHGQSDWSPTHDYGADAQFSDLTDLLGALGCDEVSILGASMGGATGYTFAAEFPRRVKRLVVVDVAPGSLSSSARRDPRPGTSALMQDRFESFDEAVSTRASVYRRPSDPYVRESIERNLMLLQDGSLSWRYDLHGILASWAASDDAERQWQRVEQITAPTLVLRGAESTLLTRELADRMCTAIPGSTLVEVPDAGHPVPMDQPALFLSAVLRFLLDE